MCASTQTPQIQWRIVSAKSQRQARDEPHRAKVPHGHMLYAAMEGE
jgi:hypothetical protein